MNGTSLSTRDKDSARAGELALVRAALRGQVPAREELARRLSILLRILTVLDRRHGNRLSRQDIEDLAQDTFLLAWGKLETFQGQSELDGWLYRFCCLEYMNRVRRHARAPRRIGVDAQELVEPDEELLDGRLESIERCLSRLGPPDEDVIRLKHFEALSFEAIAARLELPASTVKTRYYRGIAWLQHRLRGELQDGGA